MAHKSLEALPQPVDKLRAEIDDWRKTKLRRTSPMPAVLWRSASALGRVHGIYKIAKALRLDPASLNRRVIGRGQVAATSFVELWPGSESRGEKQGDTVEIANAAGDKLVIHLAVDNRVDAAALAAAFVRRSS
jgi:hypothetical protein